MYRPKSQLHPRDIRQTLQPRDAQRLYNGSVGNRVAVYARHSPHPGEVISVSFGDQYTKYSS